MAYISLSRRDTNVLEKIKDPESDPSSAIQIDATLQKDPHILDQQEYAELSQKERDIILAIQGLELQSAVPRSREMPEIDIVGGYRQCVSRLRSLIDDQPKYASARNNRAQALRRLCGDCMLVTGAPQPPQALLRHIDDAERQEMAQTVLCDLDRSISLLTPSEPYSKISPQTARTLSMAHTQRAAVYLATSKLISSNPVSIDVERRELRWTKLDFEENASRDFAMGGRYGNEIAKGLAVATNPTAKLCGQMVREAMKKEYGPDFPV
ncbi:hypothetical protein B0T24DRAFT_245486 [Lasiosphaeria ovina]|uniref:Uncharacterized protein n=1 Tax=Lasiosphaeria ovina TaxID=92902 RepID=A0AAE0KAV2_9PEZI|nr:hypothetical protein B0T24DRAFT_245486 [Lasiosphaeria ovina]